MSWIILALTLGAAITSVIHGVFMLFGSLTMSSGGGTLFGLPSTIMASLPIISATLALIGGIIAFNRSKWGALFLFIAGGLCVPSRDTWIYGGIYFAAGILCFLLKSKNNDEYQDMFYDDDYDEQTLPSNNFVNNEPQYDSEPQDFYYEDAPEQPAPIQHVPQLQPVQRQEPFTENDLIINNERPQLRRRMSKTCPECGAMVARDDRVCRNCGAELYVPSDISENQQDIQTDVPEFNNDIQNLNEQLLTPSENPATAAEPVKGFEIDVEKLKVNSNDNFYQENSDNETELNFNKNDGDYMSNAQAVQSYRAVKPVRNMRDAARVSKRSSYGNDYEEAVSSYQQFSKYTRRAKKRKRSTGRKILSMLLLVAAVGGALYFLLGLRKLPPGELPPIAVKDVKIIEQPEPSTPTSVPEENVAQTVELASPSENVLPNFNPDLSPKSGVIVGSNVNVRADHTTSSSRVTRLSVNSKVEVLGTFNVTSGQYQGIWYNIRTGGREGWIYGRYVQPLGSGLPTGYSNALLKSFGSNRSQLVETFGNPSRSSNTSVEWPGITATLKGEDITKIRVTSPNRELQNGLKTGMSQTALYQIMGFPSGVSSKILQYNEGSKTGLSVQLDRNNAITSITINEIR